MDTIIVLFVLLIIAAVFVVRGNTAEGWQPFAWYGAPPGTYKAGGDWTGVDAATRSVEIVPAPNAPKQKKSKKK
jgi:hypothetical protein